ncbi:MAG: OmpA family protein [Deltaproteobacteria bacterium]|nr:OmpA family protein [Deltaproteobacteria bacterium]
MKSNGLLIILAGAVAAGGCMATAAPQELVNARTAFKRANAGATAQVAPAELHVAHQALSRAEESFANDPESYRTRDLAYIAERRTQLAEAAASIIIEQRTQAQAGAAYQTTQGQIVAETREELGQTRAALTASEQSGELTAEQLDAEQQARIAADQRTAAALAARVAADQRTAAALAALAGLAAVEDGPRGMVITLSGSVLFASNQATLLPEALSRLGQVADALLASRERGLTIEGHTDSRGSDSDNLDLSQRRADAVRNYLVQRGYEIDLIQAHGLGEGRPIADNNGAEGRANNRRVEIIIEREPHASGL